MNMEIDTESDMKNLLCVQFPGIVKNESKALQCLGGIKNISQTYNQHKKKRLALSYQPENPYVKKVYGDCQKSAGVLLKVKVKKKRVNDEVQREVVSTSIVGRVENAFRFSSMGDFQYLPLHSDDSGPPQCILEKLVPGGLETIDFLHQPAPAFIVPGSFTRSDRPMNYAYTHKHYGEKKYPGEDNVHKRIRKERGGPPCRHKFSLHEELPKGPHEYHTKIKDLKMKTVPTLEKDFEAVKKIFDEVRPICSLNLIRYITKVRVATLKIIMPCLGYYMQNGPWRKLWVRYGFDPRKEPAARIYQTLDFRMRQHAGVYSMVSTKGEVVSHRKPDEERTCSDLPESEEIFEGTIYFKPGMLPAQRQIFYQLCDVKLSVVQEILGAEPPPGYLCHLKHGWLPPQTDEICRDHIFNNVKQTLLETRSPDFKLEQGEVSAESSDDSNSDGDDACSSTDEDGDGDSVSNLSNT